MTDELKFHQFITSWLRKVQMYDLNVMWPKTQEQVFLSSSGNTGFQSEPTIPTFSRNSQSLVYIHWLSGHTAWQNIQGHGSQPSEDVWQHPETFLLVTTRERELSASSGYKTRVLLIPIMHRTASQQNAIQPKTSILWRQRQPGAGKQTFSSLLIGLEILTNFLVILKFKTNKPLI